MRLIISKKPKFKLTIIDLTNGKYESTIGEALDYVYIINDLKEIISASFFNEDGDEITKKLCEIPIYFVDRLQSNTVVDGVHIPDDEWNEYHCGEFDIDEWLKSKDPSKEGEVCDGGATSKSGKHSNGRIEHHDRLAVYVSDSGDKKEPRQIFIWVDKIVEIAEHDTNNGLNVEDKAKALCSFVILHELSHALMDLGLYSKSYKSNFTYSDYLYRYIEEAYANAIALTCNKGIQGDDKACETLPFIRDFVLSQPEGYRDGWRLYDNGVCLNTDRKIGEFLPEIEQWMYVKFLFDDYVALHLRDFYNNKLNGLNFVKLVKDNPKEVAVKHPYGKWTILDCQKMQFINTADQYDDICTIGKDSDIVAIGKNGPILI
ncbi:MAG: hypothetical protein J6V21_07945 [Alistipes sp.]|nr:hypothetical protein [Alistipes sp.]